MKSIGIGIDDFKKLILTNSFYIDKTKFIEDIVQDTSEVQLITRPRRFGKTLNLSMLNYFYTLENREENKSLFKGLYIENSPTFIEQGKYSVIFISFKDIQAKTSQSCINSITILIGELYKKYSFILNSLNELDKPTYIKYATQNINIEELQRSLISPCYFLYTYYKKEIILLIDEYDTPIISAYEYDYYDEIKTFFTVLFGSSLKGNPYLKKAVLTGITRISKENIFSGLNNINVNSILEKSFSQYFGLTEKEVENSLKEYELEEKSKEVQNWYNGYNFGGIRVYNPYSITNFIKNKELIPYWVNSSSNSLINNLLINSNDYIFEDLSNLFLGKSIEKNIDIYANFNELKNVEQIWYLLLHSGYLTIKNKISTYKYSLIIPNEEIFSFFERDFIKSFINSRDKFDDILNDFVKCNFKTFEEKVKEIMLQIISVFDVKQNYDERYYHIFFLGMILGLRKNYYITSNRESGIGRYDIMLEPKNKQNKAFILELKIAKSEKELEKKAIEGIEQIKKKKYITELKYKELENIYLVGISFYKKTLKIIAENYKN